MGNLIKSEVDEIIGMDIDSSKKFLEKRGMTMRIIEMDGDPMLGDCAIDFNRLNVSIVKGKVIEIVSIG